MQQQDQVERMKARPPRSARSGVVLPHYAPRPQLDFLSLIPLKPVQIKLRSRPSSPACDGSQNVSLCSTRSSSSSKTIRRSVSVVSEKRKSVLESAIPALCSAKAWAISNGKNGKVISGKMEEESREIASLTKIMTCHLSLILIKDLDLSLTSEVQVSSKAANMNGTSAKLQAGDRLKLIDLLHGLMLPSGNDAAQCLAEYFGKRLAERKAVQMTKDFDKLFIREMNVQAEKLKLRRTLYQNPHGMSIKRNHSTARDVNTLACVALRQSLFRSIVHTQVYTCSILDRKGETRLSSWENTNKLLEKGYEGVKTGVTDAAGPCLCASWRQGEQRILVTVLGSKSMEERWEEVPRLVAWALPKLA